MKILVTVLLSIFIFVHPLFSQQPGDKNELRDVTRITAGLQIRVLAPGIAYKLARGDRFFPVEGVVESTRVDTIIFKSKYYDSLLCIPATSIKVLEIKHQLTRSEKARIARKGYVGAGIGALAGGLVMTTFGSSSADIRYALPFLGAANGYFIGVGNKSAMLGLVVGAAIGGAIGAYKVSKDEKSANGFLEGVENIGIIAGIFLGSQIGMVVGGIIGLSTGSEKNWIWKEIPPDKFQIGVNPQTNGGPKLYISARL